MSSPAISLEDERLRTEVAAQIHVLPVLQRQLQETAANVESAVVQVCGNFRAMAERAHGAVAAASSIVGSGSAGAAETANVERLLQDVRAAIDRLLQRSDRSAQISARALAGMEEVSQAAGRIVQVLSAVERIARENRILAVNAKIQSVHADSAGAGFRVVADEIAAQAVRSVTLTDQINDIVANLNAAVSAASQGLSELVASGAQLSDQFRADAEGTLSQLREVHESNRRSLAAMSAEAERLADDISSAIVHLQFQDRVSQRIQHVVEVLAAMEAALSGAAPCETSSERKEEVLAAMQERYTMESERTALDGASDTASAEGSVELF